MNNEFKRCLETNKIVPVPRAKELVKKEISVSQSDLSDAKAGFEQQRYKWLTIQAGIPVFDSFARAARAINRYADYCLKRY